MMCWLSELAKIYADSGRPSIPPELRALLLQAFYNVAAPANRSPGAQARRCLRALSLLRGVRSKKLCTR
jgi:hypothetical protein